MNTEKTISALHIALRFAHDRREVETAIRAVRMSSPIADVRTRRAIANALSNYEISGGQGYDLADDDRQLLGEVLAGIEDDGGVLPIGDEPRLAHIHMRVEPAQKSRFVKAAQRRGMKLTEFIMEACEREISRRD